MKRQRLYIGISIVIIVLIVGLLGWSIFIGRQQQELQQGTEDLGFFSGGGSGSGGGITGLFGGALDDRDNDTDANDQGVQGTPDPVLRQLYNLPTAGFATTASSTVRFVDKATGHVFEKELPNNSARRVEQTTVPKLLSAYLVEDAQAVIRQYTDEVGRVVTVYKDFSEPDQESPFLPLHIQSIAVSPNTQRIAYLEDATGEGRVYVANPDGTERELVWASRLTGWSVAWPKENTLLLVQAPSAYAPGVAYTLNLESKVTDLVHTPQIGFSAVAGPESGQMLVSELVNSRPQILLKSAKGVFIRTPVATFAEKCAWSPVDEGVYCGVPERFENGTYPDSWYQGTTHFGDKLIALRTSTSTPETLLEPVSDQSLSLDMTKLSMSADGRVLFFINHTDQTLWSVTFPTPETESAAEESQEDNV